MLTADTQYHGVLSTCDLLVAAHGILLQQDRNQGRGRNRDERSNDPCQGCAEEQGDKDSKPHQVYARAHDARDQEGVLDVDIDCIEDQHAGHLAPGVDGRDDGDQHDRHDAAGDGNQVEQTHKKAQQNEVADVENAKDDSAGDSQDEHQEALAEQPLAHLVIGCLESLVETAALIAAKEGEKELIGVFAFEHKVDAEKYCRQNVEDVGEPVGQRGKEIGSGRGQAIFRALCDGVDAELGGEGKLLNSGDNPGHALRQVGGEVLEIAEDRRKSAGEERSKKEADDDNEDEDRDNAGGVIAAEPRLPDAIDDRHQHDGEQCADVEDLDLLGEIPREREQEKDGNGEEDVAVNLGARPLLRRGDDGSGGWKRGSQRVLLNSVRTVSCRDLFSGCFQCDAESVRFQRSGAGVRSLVQGVDVAQQQFDGLGWGEVGGLDGEGGQAPIKRLAAGEP